MGVVLRDRDADYSAIAIGELGISTSIVSDLVALYQTRTNASRAAKNWAPGMPNGFVSGSPAYDPTHMTFSAAGQWTGNSRPLNGDNSFAIIIRSKNGGDDNDANVGSFSSSAEGACYWRLNDRKLVFETTTSTNASTIVSVGVLNAEIEMAPGEDGVFHLFVATMQAGVGLKLYHPQSNTEVTAALAGGRFFTFTADAGIVRALTGSVTNTQDVSMIAHWTGALTDEEVETFYTEMRSQFGVIGIDL